MERGAPAHLKSFIVVFSLLLDLRVRDTAAQLGEYNAMGLIESWSSRGYVEALIHQKQGDSTIRMGSIDKGMSIMAQPIVVSRDKVNFMVVWLVWTFGTTN